MLISCPPPKYSQKKTLYSEPYTTPHMANLEGTSHVKEHSPTQSSPKNLNFIPTKTQQHSSHELNSVEFPFYQFKTSNTFQTLTFQKQPIQQAL